MTIKLNQFSDLLGARNLRDTDVLTVTDRNDLKLKSSRFPVLRWIVNSGIGKRAGNRKTVDVFLGAMKSQFGGELVDKMQLDTLRDLQRRGKPLNVRHVRNSVEQAMRLQYDASAVVDEIERNISDSAYSSSPGGMELAREVRDGIDFPALFKTLQTDLDNYRGQDRIWSVIPNVVGRVASTAHNEAFRHIFLSGYGVQQDGMGTGRLQRIIEELPETGLLLAEHGMRLDSSRMPPAFFEELGVKLQRKTDEAMLHPERLPQDRADEPFKQRLAQQLSRTAEQFTQQYMQGRLQALGALRQTQEAGADAAAAHAPAPDDKLSAGLREQILHSRIPAGEVPRLLALRNEMPGNLDALAAPEHPIEDKFRLLHGFGSLVVRAITEMTPEDQAKYASGPESLSFMEDCANFLKHENLSDAAAANIREALCAEPATDLARLYQSLQDIKYAAERNSEGGELKTDPVWGEAYRAIERTDAAYQQFPGYWQMLDRIDVDENRLYTDAALPAYQALRSLGINAPPPTDAGSA
ncbi:MAG: hypothetical protein OXI88_02630 [Gammaproteobacteria bacterium]|nr:hypothetical protein [Gammaproteobacteria bacterium]MDE0282994.1 hypothetical protein [Gammaproteobacteria bacterium]MDE0510667.1 hypothetical protein [Gammaproteobacteria bacterium]